MTSEQKSIWSEALASEIQFWDDWMQTKGSRWQDAYTARINPSRPLIPPIADIVRRLGFARASILDVGAGPITSIGYRLQGREISITAVDALADEYDRLLERHGIEPPVRTRLCEGENLAAHFSPQSFDLAVAINSLDHAYDPLRIISTMVDLVKPGGYVYLQHFRNEAVNEGYEGLHQWNFDVADGALILWGARHVHNVSQFLADRIDSEELRFTRAGFHYRVSTKTHGGRPDAQPDILAKLNELAAASIVKGRLIDADALYVEALATVRATLPKGHAEIGNSLLNLASVTPKEAPFKESLFKETLEIRRATLAEGDPDIVSCLNRLGAFYQDLGRLRDAEEYYLEALVCTRHALECNQAEIATSLFNLASLYKDRGNNAEAIALYLQALTVRRALLPEDDPAVVSCLRGLTALKRDRVSVPAEPRGAEPCADSVNVTSLRATAWAATRQRSIASSPPDARSRDRS